MFKHVYQLSLSLSIEYVRMKIIKLTFNLNNMMVPVSRKKREWTELDGTAVSRRSVARVRVNSGDPGRCPKICLKEPGPNGTSAGFQTDENRYYTLILAEKAEKR